MERSDNLKLESLKGSLLKMASLKDPQLPTVAFIEREINNLSGFIKISRERTCHKPRPAPTLLSLNN